MKKTQVVGRSLLLLLLGACGTAAPAEPGELEAETGERELTAEDEQGFSGFFDGLGDEEDTSDGESFQSIDKALIDGTLSCNTTMASLICPNITMSAANGEILLVSANDPSLILAFRRNPAVTVREVLASRPAGVSLNSISCGPQSGSITFRDVFAFRLPVETRASTSAADPRRLNFSTNVFPSNYPGGMMDNFICTPRTFALSATGFRTKSPSFQSRYVSHRMVTDAQTPNDGRGMLEITCEYTLGGIAPQIEATRPRDIVSSNSSQFLLAETLSATETQQRCNAMCFNDCAVVFGPDAQGAQNCTDICTPDCVRAATTNIDDCPSCRTACTRPSDCGSPSDFNCVSGCCAQIIR